MFHKNLD